LTDVSDGSHEPDIDSMVAYHQEMEFAAINGGNCTGEAPPKHARDLQKAQGTLGKNVQDI
jgi:hypothetical protein